MSYKVNLIHIIILIVNHTKNYGSYLTYEYLFYYNSFCGGAKPGPMWWV